MSKVPKESLSEEKVKVAVPKKPRVTSAKATMSVMVALWEGDFCFSWTAGFTVKENIILYLFFYRKAY